MEPLISFLRKFNARYEVPLFRTLNHDILELDPLHQSDITLTCDLVTGLDIVIEFDLFIELQYINKKICNGCSMSTKDAYSSGHLVLSHFGLACLILEIIFREICRVSWASILPLTPPLHGRNVLHCIFPGTCR